MPRNPKSKLTDLPAIPPELLASFSDGPMTAEAINTASLAFKKTLIERALGGEMNHHLGYPSGAAKPVDVANQRNGKGAKTVRTGEGLCVSRCRATATAASRRCLSRSTSGVSRALTTRSSRCTPEG